MRLTNEWLALGYSYT